MYRIILLVALASGACAARMGEAATTAYYNPATGGLYIKNTTQYGAIAIYSDTIPNIAKTDLSLYASFPASSLDSSELPREFMYYNFPIAENAPYGAFIGNVIVPGTPTSSIKGQIALALADPPFRDFPVVEIPEPATSALATAAAIGCTVSLRRRQA